jgi:UDP-GlcNAc3NAcA epimerase
MLILTILGARPQFVKAAVVSRALARKTQVTERIIHTGQHHDTNMSDIFFEEMEIPRPAFNLGIHGKSHGAMTGQMMEGLEKLFIEHKPGLVLVYGDTNSTLAGALAASKLHIPVAHVEAGLRSFNMQMPEEVNRILTDRVSSLLFCPTSVAMDNLRKEGYPFGDMELVMSGDVMLDAARYYAQRSEQQSSILNTIDGSDFLLCTVHRAENTDDPEKLRHIFSALAEINKEVKVVCPLHPRTRKIAIDRGLELPSTVVDPVGYFDMLELLKHCKAVLTDSGGLQKEAYFFAKPCITLRNETEWTELVDAGCNILAGAERDKILASWATVKAGSFNFRENLYGDGHAAEVIVETILSGRWN